jgi:thioredoxin-dependent peroxiredoxin
VIGSAGRNDHWPEGVPGYPWESGTINSVEETDKPPLQPGEPFPVDLLPSVLRQPDGTLNGPTVVYFYPKDGTETCTREAVEFSRHAGEFEQAGLALIGVSTDSAHSHAEFAQAHSLSVDLVSDADLELSRSAGVLRDFGEHGVLAGRVTFLLDRAGTIREVWAVQDVAAHPAKVLEAAARLQADDR